MAKVRLMSYIPEKAEISYDWGFILLKMLK